MSVDLTAALAVALLVGVPLAFGGVLGLGWLEGRRTRRRQSSVDESH